MQASHNTDFDSRCHHEYDFFSNSAVIVFTPGHSACHRVRTGSDFHASGATSGEARNFLACQKSRRRPHDGLIPCCHRVSIFTTGKPPYGHRVPFVCGPCDHRFWWGSFAARGQHGGDTMPAGGLSKATRRRVAFVIPLTRPITAPCNHRILLPKATRCYFWAGPDYSCLKQNKTK